MLSLFTDPTATWTAQDMTNVMQTTQISFCICRCVGYIQVGTPGDWTGNPMSELNDTDYIQNQSII